MKNTFIVPGAIVAAGAILAVAVYVVVSPGAPALEEDEHPNAMRPVSGDDHILGNPAAKVIIVEYSDFECPHCKLYDNVLRQIMNEAGPEGEIALVHRNFALTELHANARGHAIAAECVAHTAGNDAYWRFAELLYRNQPANPAKYAEYAHAASASPEAVAACIQNAGSNGIAARVDADRENALAIGARGAPYSILVTRSGTLTPLAGAWSYADLKEKLTAAANN